MGLNKKYIIGLILLISLEIAGVSFLAVWRAWFWDAVSNKDLHLFIKYLIEFTVCALGLVFVSGYKGYIINFSSLLIRTALTKKALSNINKVEGYQQRIQEDCNQYPLLSISLISSLGSSIVQTIIFSSIVIYQSSLHNLLYVVLYTIIGTYIASKIAKPLIDLNYSNQVAEAAFRQELTEESYAKVYKSNWSIFIRLKYLQYFQAFFNQITIIIPLLILSSSYFSGILTFGVLMQLVSCISSVIDQGSYFVNNFDGINRWLSCKKRLKESGII